MNYLTKIFLSHLFILGFSASCFAACQHVQADLSPKGIEQRLAPVAKVTIGADLPSAPGTLGPDAGQKRYTANCAMCHTTGLAGAPKYGDKAAWAPRVSKGLDALLKSVVHGLNAMPPRGGCTTCSDEELSLAIKYMLEKIK